MNFKPSKKVTIIALLVLLLVGLPLALNQSQISQFIRQFAWQTTQKATAVCSPESNYVIIRVEFTNNESNKEIEVSAKDIQSGVSVRLDRIAAGETKEAEIDTGLTTLKDGVVLFELKSTQGYDQFAANYKAIVSCAAPLSQPTTQPSPPMCPAGVSPNQGFCRWDASTGVTAYKVIVKESGTGKTVKEETLNAPATESSFIMEPEKAYQCTVTPVNTCGTGANASSPEKICSVPPPPPFCPAEPLTTSSCVWDLLEGATAYKVDIINDKTGKVIKSEQVNAPDYRLVYESEPGVAYKCSVAPVNACTGGKAVVSEPKVCVVPTGTPYPSDYPTPTPTEEPTPTPTEEPTSTPEPTPTPSPSPTPTPTLTPTPKPTSTPKPTPTRIPTPTPRIVVQPGQTIIQRGGVRIVQQPAQVIVVTQPPVYTTPRPTVKPTGDSTMPVIAGGLTLIVALAGALLFFAL